MATLTTARALPDGTTFDGTLGKLTGLGLRPNLGLYGPVTPPSTSYLFIPAGYDRLITADGFVFTVAH